VSKNIKKKIQGVENTSGVGNYNASKQGLKMEKFANN
jgi:hypothetical protein